MFDSTSATRQSNCPVSEFKVSGRVSLSGKGSSVHRFVSTCPYVSGTLQEVNARSLLVRLFGHEQLDGAVAGMQVAWTKGRAVAETVLCRGRPSFRSLRHPFTR